MEIIDNGQLLIQSINTTATASVTTTGQSTIITNRGNVKKVTIEPGTDTVADLAVCTITILINSVEVIQTVPLSLFSRTTQAIQKMFKVNWAEGSTIGFRIVNGSGNNIPVAIILYFDN
ncbi:MAG: hypothetical protein NW207_04790 [Cytophagales bacterium]|nr:hypothetical protein [Cytophagales bacterium]